MVDSEKIQRWCVILKITGLVVATIRYSKEHSDSGYLFLVDPTK